MGITLVDNKTEEIVFDINFWNWRAIVEEIRRLNIISSEKLDGLHEPFCCNGLTMDECRLVAHELRSRVMAYLGSDERILLNGIRTKDKDTYEFFKEEFEKNYSTNKDVLEVFVKCCETCNGFEVF